MADQLYLSLWFPNFRFDTLPAALVSVIRQFALVGGEKRVAAASVYPISFSEAPVYQRIYVNDERSEETSASIIETAVAEATEQLHDDMAYEFEMRWNLWAPEVASNYPTINPDFDPDADVDPEYESAPLDPLWKLQPATVRILGFGPKFDD